MNTQYDENLILAYVEHQLADDDRARFEEELRKDPRLARLVQQLSSDRDLLRGLPSLPPPAQLMDPVNNRLERSMLLSDSGKTAAIPIAHRRLKTSRFIAYSSIAALVLLCGGVAIQLIVVTLEVPQPGNPNLHLADGTGTTSPEGTTGRVGGSEIAGERSRVDGVPAAPTDAGRTDRDRFADARAFSGRHEDLSPPRTDPAHGDAPATSSNVPSTPGIGLDGPDDEARKALALASGAGGGTSGNIRTDGFDKETGGALAMGTKTQPTMGPGFENLHGQIAPGEGAMTLYVESSDPQRTQRQITQWAVFNAATVEGNIPSARPTNNASRSKDDITAHASPNQTRQQNYGIDNGYANSPEKQKLAADQLNSKQFQEKHDVQQNQPLRNNSQQNVDRVVVKLRRSQVPVLVDFLNSFPTQRAREVYEQQQPVQQLYAKSYAGKDYKGSAKPLVEQAKKLEAKLGENKIQEQTVLATPKGGEPSAPASTVVPTTQRVNQNRVLISGDAKTPAPRSPAEEEIVVPIDIVARSTQRTNDAAASETRPTRQ